MYRTAEGFYFAMHLLKRRTIGEAKATLKKLPFKVIGPTDRLLAPQFALQAFSLELYFKALLQRENGSLPKNGHDLQKLFQNLNDITQAAIKYEYENCPQESAMQRAAMAKSGLPVDFDSCLQISKDAFVEQRYIYEHSEWPDVLLEDILGAVRSYIYRNYADWMYSLPPIDMSVPPISG